MDTNRKANHFCYDFRRKMKMNEKFILIILLNIRRLKNLLTKKKTQHTHKTLYNVEPTSYRR